MATGGECSTRPAATPSTKHEYDFPHCRPISNYDLFEKIGQGTFGEVWKARCIVNREKIFAVKKILTAGETEGFPITALREIRILKLVKHANIVNLIEICHSPPTPYNRNMGSFYLVFEFCDHDLAGILSNANVKFNLGEIKMVVKQLLNALYYIHANKILHRDIKSANILMTKSGVLKLADFGLARAFSECKPERPNRYTNRVVTLWYRPPELLLGERNYTSAVDMWGAGCILAEMFTRTPILQGSSEQEQLKRISLLYGSICPENWPNVDQLELYCKLELPKGEKRKVKERLREYIPDENCLDLLDKLMVLDPRGRLDADSALDHDFFWTDPMPVDLGNMLAQHTASMFSLHVPPRPSQQAPRAALPPPGQGRGQPRMQGQVMPQPTANRGVLIRQHNPGQMFEPTY